ncbi:MAG TPA: DUF2309 domain-containing protein [Gammaproteobacteria bacterium]|nr:DUF2309 domain-containing protein [Gammaproteobacteria bacterium]
MHAEANTFEKNAFDSMPDKKRDESDDIAFMINEAWKTISPWWPLKNLIATNPLKGFEDLSFEQSLDLSMRYFQNRVIQKHMVNVNRETIKWCQVFFDEGQAAINMPGRNHGIYHAWRALVHHDDKIHQNNSDNIEWLNNLPHCPEEVIQHCLQRLNIPLKQQKTFLSILLTSLPGWASYIKYKTEWAPQHLQDKHTLTNSEYVAIRIIITCLHLPDAVKLIAAFEQMDTTNVNTTLNAIRNNEMQYERNIANQFSNNITNTNKQKKPIAQLVFCIDVRSEPFRRAIEAQGDYETFGFAGFFGIPALIEDKMRGETYASCPVLLKPKHTIKCRHTSKQFHAGASMLLKKIYRRLKYNVVTPFALAEAMGPFSGLWMAARMLLPSASKYIYSALNHMTSHDPLIEHTIPLESQIEYAESALRTMGLTLHFAPIVVLCGHGSSSENNAYATALDCGACGGHDGAANAKLLAQLLNNPLVKNGLKKKGVSISDDTTFIAALHNTTTDQVTLYCEEEKNNTLIKKLNADLKKAQEANCKARLLTLTSSNHANKLKMIKQRSCDWSETRPEWGLARNAAFIVGPRDISKEINLDGRAFLHSYCWEQDKDGSALRAILTAPMVVAQWINAQYLFSTLDNIAYGSGSKITQNITGEIGVMQGNASDLMHGLPLQSIAINDHTTHHQALRLLTMVHAKKALLDNIIQQEEVLKKLFGNGWVNLMCLDPEDKTLYKLQRNLSWSVAKWH